VGALLPNDRQAQLNSIDNVQLTYLEGAQLPQAKRDILAFIARYGERRITGKAKRWLRRLHASDLQIAQGTLILIAHHGRHMIGVLGLAHFGRECLFIVVRRGMRGRKIGQQMIRKALSQTGALIARVATDNTPSMAMFFASGLSAVSLERGVTGKPTLIFAVGPWRQQP
jgi:hypothetical protein